MVASARAVKGAGVCAVASAHIGQARESAASGPLERESVMWVTSQTRPNLVDDDE